MEKYYKLVFVYPDGHLEEIEETFNTEAEAAEYGENLTIQVENTEGNHRGSDEKDEFGFKKKKIKPYYMILLIEGKDYRLVRDSRSK